MKIEKLYNTKIKLKSSEESEKVQKALFKLGCGWGGNKEQRSDYLSAENIYIDSRGCLTYSHDGYDETYFKTHSNKEIKVTQILNPNDKLKKLKAQLMR